MIPSTGAVNHHRAMMAAGITQLRSTPPLLMHEPRVPDDVRCTQLGAVYLTLPPRTIRTLALTTFLLTAA
jgi:hypothetical protein